MIIKAICILGIIWMVNTILVLATAPRLAIIPLLFCALVGASLQTIFQNNLKGDSIK